MRPSILNPLFADVTALPKIGPKLAQLIARAAGPRVVDVLLQPPTGLVDRSARPRLADAKPGQIVTVEVSVDRHDPPRIRKLPYRVRCSDETGFLTLVFFHARPDYLKGVLPPGARRIVSGRIDDFEGERQMTHPDHIIDPDDASALPLFEPVYPLTTGLTNAVMRRAVQGALARAPQLEEWQNPAWIKKQGWPGWRASISMMHAPDGVSAIDTRSPHRSRLAYDELLANQLAILLIRRSRRRSSGRALVGDGALRAAAEARLPFALTADQTAALEEILGDIAKPERMVRLLQGDVGSGKTAVALLAMLSAAEAGAQSALMAPTEILARQHAETIAPVCTALNIQVTLLTGRDKGATRASTLAAIASGAARIVIGTHALFQEDVSFSNLGLIVVDEQHRFGVHQRLALAEKGLNPHLLVMTATPIPRTLALTAYGDMDASALRNKPPGRKPVVTVAAPIERMDEVVDAVGRTIDAGEQVYWVCPLVEESEDIELTAAEIRAADLARRFGDRVGLVHGRLSSPEKDAVMERFHSGSIAVLVATTVIEVGVNAPNASVIVIENAERFGLAQLHQLRGRVGRGDRPATCVLLYKGPLGETAKARLSILRETQDGFRIAEEDLRLRGAGDILGAAQSGFPLFRLADLVDHAELLAVARDDAKLIVEIDPELKGARGGALRTLLYLFGRDDAAKLLRAG